MKKSKKILSVVLALAILITSTTLMVSAATGENILNIIRTVIEKDRYFVNGTEVTEDEFTKAQNTNPNETITKYNDHKLTINYKYQDENGNPITETELFKDLNNITITADDLTALNSGSLGDYISFETDLRGNLVGAKIKGDKVCGIEYKFTDGYMTFCNCSNDKYYYEFSGAGYIYPVNENDKNTLYFKHSTETNESQSAYYLCERNGTRTESISKGDYIFYFENDDNYNPISFGFIFDKITLYLSE